QRNFKKPKTAAISKLPKLYKIQNDSSEQSLNKIGLEYCDDHKLPRMKVSFSELKKLKKEKSAHKNTESPSPQMRIESPSNDQPIIDHNEDLSRIKQIILESVENYELENVNNNATESPQKYKQQISRLTGD